jgi:hypothetical protein
LPEEAERLGQRHVGTEHLLLVLLRQEDALAALTLPRHAAHLAEIRLKLAGNASRYREPTTRADSPYSYRVASRPARSAMDAVSSFLSGLKSKTSPELADFFADNGQFIDASGKIWFGREEIKKEFERLFAASLRRIRAIASGRLFLSVRRQCWYRFYGRTRCTRYKRRDR